MKKRDLFIIIYSLTITVSIIYAIQPIQPLLANEFQISIAQASQFTGVVMLFLAISPIIYGYVLEKVSVKKMLLSSLFILFVANSFLGFSSTYEYFLFFRTIEALVLPAILTSLMSILANIDKKNIKLNMSIYVASTVFGGLFGRIFSGYIATSLSYHFVFYLLSFGVLLCIYFIYTLSYEEEPKIIKPKLADIANILKDKRFFLIYFMMFTLYFVFGGVLNVLPFHVVDIMPKITEFEISLLYFGYAFGLLVSLNTARTIKLFGNEFTTITVGVVLFLTTTLLLVFENIIFIFFLICLFCLSMFMVHTVSTGLINTLKESQKSLTSGIYLAFYYTGGTLGSVIPAIIYEKFGWEILMYIFGVILSSILMLVTLNRKLF